MITPDNTPERFNEAEAALFRAGKCPWLVSPVGDLAYCGKESQPGADFGHCPEHAAQYIKNVLNHSRAGLPE